MSAPVINFRDDGTGAPYDALDVEFDADSVINRAYVKGLNNNEATDSDAASIAKYFTQTTSITNSLLHLQAEIDALAAYLLEPDPAPRFTAVSTSFSRLSNAQRTSAAAIDIGDTIDIEKQIPGLGGSNGQELAVEGILGEIDVATGHRITFFTAPTTIVYELILDDAVYGVLDAENVLG